MAERPKDLIYARDEKPPAIPLIAIGFQHVAVICPYLVMVALVAETAKHRLLHRRLSYSLSARRWYFPRALTIDGSQGYGVGFGVDDPIDTVRCKASRSGHRTCGRRCSWSRATPDWER